jgi:hypothetical protein
MTEVKQWYFPVYYKKNRMSIYKSCIQQLCKDRKIPLLASNFGLIFLQKISMANAFLMSPINHALALRS